MKIARIALLASLIASFAMPLPAADKVFEGTLVCAKCYLKKPDAKECQDVLLVPQAKGAKAEYYITKNEVAKKAGEACTTEVKARVTGTVSLKDDRTWLTPSKIEKQ
jgi:Family of unknown function (DUF6370)